jgi:oxygen-independent coproporphyrinogen-3 oxidase
MKQLNELIEKYHVAAPRYTSYPTVPYWNATPPTAEEWTNAVKASFQLSNKSDGISVYVHLPYCESLCTYCGCNTRITKNHEVEVPYITAILKEWDLYLAIFDEQPIIKEIHLGGGTPTFFSANNLKLLLNGLLAKSVVHPDAEFSFEAHPANTLPEHLTALYELGFKRLSLGIQDFDPEVQLIINRFQTFEQVEEITQLARKIGYTSINYDLIYGLPLQNLSGLEETIRQVGLLKPDRLAFYSYAHVPWVKPGQRKFTEAHLPTLDEKQALYEMGRRLFVELGYEEVGMDHFALPGDSLFEADKNGKMHRNFMGYTHQYTRLLVGLGVSSIGDSWTAFAQNVKKVEDYLDLIANGELPIFKGHLLSAEDQIIRKHILQIMCQGKTDWSEDFYQTPSLSWALSRLDDLQADGLISFDDKGLKVLPLGKRFLRNICMALDTRLWDKQTEEQIFSMSG